MEYWVSYSIDPGRVLKCDYCKNLMRHTVFVHRKCTFGCTCLYVNGCFCDNCVITIANKEWLRIVKLEEKKREIPTISLMELKEYDKDCIEIIELDIEIVEEKNVI